MKNTARKLLSLLMVIAMLCSTIPTALAASYDYEDNDGIKWTNECDGGGDHDYYLSSCSSNYEYYKCDDCNEKGRIAHDWVYDWYDDEDHLVWCSNEDCDYFEDTYEAHDFDDDDQCIYCEGQAGLNLKLEIEKGDDLSGSHYDYAEDVTVSVTVSVWDKGEKEYVNVDDIGYYFYFDWEGDLWDASDEEKSSPDSSAFLNTTLDKCTAKCTVSLFNEDDVFVTQDRATWTFYSSDEADYEIDVSAVVSSDNGKLCLNDKDDEGGDSIEDQIADAADELGYSLEFIKFSNVTDDGGVLNAKKSRNYYYKNSKETNPDYEISGLFFTPEEDFDGKAEFEFTATCYNKKGKEVTADGIITIEVEDTVSKDDTIEVSAIVANNTGKLYLNKEDEDGNDSIEDQIADAVDEQGYSLEFIKFSNVTDDGGTLNAKKSRSYYYRNCDESKPSYYIADVYFTPEDDFDSKAEFAFTATCYNEKGKEVTADGIITIEVEGYVSKDDTIEVSAIVAKDTEKLYLEDSDDEGNLPIEEQIADAAYNLDYYVEYIKFSNVTDDGGTLSAKTSRDYYYWNCDESEPLYYISEVYFTPEENYTGKAEFEFIAYCYNDDDKLVKVNGVLTIEVDTRVSEPIYQMAVSGIPTELDKGLFVDFWEDAYPNGTLKYVTFTDISSGKLYDGYVSSSNKGTSMAAKKAYLNPTSSQNGLDDLSYVPGNNYIGSATIEFTASGTTKNSDKSNTNVKGSIIILCTKEEVPTITYNVRNFTTLDAADFTDVYKKVTGATTISTNKLAIKFLDLPVYGSLCMTSASLSSFSYGVAMTKSDIEKYTFSASSSATNSISDLSYTAAGVPASVAYACYYGDSLKFIGSIDFKIASIPVINLTCTTMGTVFKAADFFNPNNADTKDAAYIVFDTPSSGTLYKNFANGTGTKVVAFDKFAAAANTALGYADISTVGFMPAGAGESTLTYRIFYRNGSFISGSVKFTVTAPVSFTDVPVGSYYYDAVRWAVENGVTTGTTATTYSPANSVTRGQAVTYLYRAAGSPEPKTTVNPFVDVSTSDYYYKAVLWAVENGIITGTTTTTFSPKLECTYGMIITILWRFNGRPPVAYTGTQYYAQPVAWANSLNLLSDTTSAFSPTANSNRADIITYMFRAASK